MHPANKIRNLKRRVERARRGGAADRCVTCPASRHVHSLAESILTRGFDLADFYDEKEAAGSLLSVLESLWKARAELARLNGGHQ